MAYNFKRIGRVVSALAVMLLFAAVAYAAEHGGGHGGEHAMFTHEKLMDLLFRTLNFAALCVILVKYVKKPIVNGLAARRRSIREEFEDLEARKAEAENKYNEYEAKISRLDEEVEQIISAAVSQGEAEKARIIAEGERAAEEIRRQAENAVANEIAVTLQRLRAEIAEEVTGAAEKLIAENLSVADQKRLIEESLGKVGAIQ